MVLNFSFLEYRLVEGLVLYRVSVEQVCNVWVMSFFLIVELC